MSGIPKIKFSSSRKREKCVLDFDCSTTANFGVIQPTMAREMMPKSKFSVKVDTLVRLAGMPVPTFGRMFLTHRHVFVPYIDVCPQFDSFLSGQPYKIPEPLVFDDDNKSGIRSESIVYDSLPSLDLSIISKYLLSTYANWTIYKKNESSDDDEDDANKDVKSEQDYFTSADTWQPILLPEDPDSEEASDALDELKEAWDDILHSSTAYVYGKQMTLTSLTDAGSILPNNNDGGLVDIGYSNKRGFNQKSSCLCGYWNVVCDNTIESDNALFTYGAADYAHGSLTLGGYVQNNANNEWINIDEADYVGQFGSTGQYLIAFKLKGVAKRVRTILQGLGYQFTPMYDTSDTDNGVPYCNWLKLLAFYKAWFALYRPKRELSFTDTICYDLIKQLELPEWYDALYVDGYTPTDLVKNFFVSLGRDCYNYLPQDYFGMSVKTPYENYQRSDDILYGNFSSTAPSSGTNQVQIKSEGNAPSTNFQTYGSDVPALVQMGLRILKYVGKNTIIGRNISDYFYTHFGIGLDTSHDLDSVVEIGSMSIPIQISDVQSQASTESAHLGQYSGFGIGYNKDSQEFSFENTKNFGVWITLTCIMPKSGYYQGILRENNNLKKFDFYTPEFDALGYEVLQRSEISADYPVSANGWVTRLPQSKKAFGFVPRYSSYKVGRNIVNGDLSLRSMRNSMSGYTLDRMLPYDSGYFFILDGVQTKHQLNQPSYIPGVVYDGFRKIDATDNLGNYNRIFYDTANDEDHFIINSVFSVDAYLPAKSLNESFDTIISDEDNIKDITHA